MLLLPLGTGALTQGFPRDTWFSEPLPISLSPTPPTPSSPAPPFRPEVGGAGFLHWPSQSGAPVALHLVEEFGGKSVQGVVRDLRWGPKECGALGGKPGKR